MAARVRTGPPILKRARRPVKEAAFLRYDLAARELMIVVHVRVHVRAESVDHFRAATLANAAASVQEPGVARFDVLQQADDPARFALIEVYRTADAVAAHKETAHYKMWRDTVETMMAEPRSSTKFVNVFPDDRGW